MKTVIIALHILRGGQHKIVQTRREVGIAIECLIDRVVFEPQVENAVRSADIRRGKSHESSRRELAAELRACDICHFVRGTAAEACSREIEVCALWCIQRYGIE